MPEAQDTSCNYQGHAVLIAAGMVECGRCKHVLQNDHVSKCRHDVYMPSGDSINTACSICRGAIATIDYRSDRAVRAEVLKTHPEMEEEFLVKPSKSSDEDEEEVEDEPTEEAEAEEERDDSDYGSAEECFE